LTRRAPRNEPPPPGRPPAPSGELAALLQALPLLVFVSGGTALVYETLWLREFGFVFGNTTRAVSLVLATFMAGLALGSAAVGVAPLRRPARAYALVEAGIGASALLTLPLLRGLPGFYADLAPRLGEGSLGELVRAGLAAAIVLPTTALAGATLPLAVEIATRARGELRARFASLYSLNTLGAAAGVAAAALVGLPAFGVTGSFRIAAVANLLIAAVVWRRRDSVTEAEAPAADPGTPLPPLPAVVAAGAGFASFVLEVVWTRTLALVVGSSFYSFSLMLVAFLLGIALGAALYRLLRSRLGNPRRSAARICLAIGAMVLACLPVLGRLPEGYMVLLRVLPVSFAAHQAGAFALCLLTILPLTTAFGFLLPALTHLARAESGDARRLSGLLYAWNTVGAVAGALLAERALVPLLGLQGAILGAAALPLALGAWLLVPERPLLRPAAAGAALAATLAAAHHWRPWDPLLMSAGVYKYGIAWRLEPAARDLGSYLAERRRMELYREGREAVVSVVEAVGTGRRFIAVNGKTEAGDGAEDAVTQRFIAHVPLLLHPGPEDALVIGWGAGATAGSAGLHPLRRLDCVEIEPATFEAAPLFERINHGVFRDPRFRIFFEDARGFLLRAGDRYDAILSEPSNPWISGVSNLFTRDFYRLVADRLAPDGVFCQWFHYYNLGELDVRIQLATFRSAFPEASVWIAPPLVGPDGSARLLGDMLLIGSRHPLALDHGRVERALRDERLASDLDAGGGLADPVSLAATWTLGSAELDAFLEAGPPVPLNTDDHPHLELSAPAGNVMEPERAAEQTRELYATLTAAAGVTPPLANHPGDPAALLRELADAAIRLGRPATARARLTASLELDGASAAGHARLGTLLRATGEPLLAEQHLRRALELEPGHLVAGDALATLYVARSDLERAAEAYAGILARHPEDATTHGKLGALLIQQGRLEPARAHLARAVELDPALTVAADLLRRLDEALARRSP
jgi:spermidine synthase